MSLRIFVPRDAGAVAVGADEVARALDAPPSSAARHRDRPHRLARPVLAGADGRSRDAARAASRYGPVTAADAAAVLDADGSPTARIRCGSAGRTKFRCSSGRPA